MFDFGELIDAAFFARAAREIRRLDVARFSAVDQRGERRDARDAFFRVGSGFKFGFAGERFSVLAVFVFLSLDALEQFVFRVRRQTSFAKSGGFIRHGVFAQTSDSRRVCRAGRKRLV